MKQSTKALLAVAVSLAIVIGIAIAAFGFGAIGLGYKTWFGKANANVEHANFKEGTTYFEGMLDDLAKYKLEMVKAEDDVERAAIAELVVARFANFDVEKIENADLADFLEDCLEGNYIVKESK